MRGIARPDSSGFPAIETGISRSRPSLRGRILCRRTFCSHHTGLEGPTRRQAVIMGGPALFQTEVVP